MFFSSERRKDLDDTPSWVRTVKDDVDDPTGDFKKIYQMLSTKPLASIAKPALSFASVEAVLLSSATALIKATPDERALFVICLAKMKKRER